MNRQNEPEFEKYWNLLSRKKWIAICIWRHIIVTFLVLVLLFFAGIFLMIISWALSELVNFELYNYVGWAIIMPIPSTIIVITACLWANYSLWIHFDKLKEIEIPAANGRAPIRYKVVHLEDYFPIPDPLRFGNTYHYTGFIYRRNQQIIYVQHPETNEIFGYCRKCHQLMTLEQVQERKCPHCGNKIYYWGAH